MRSLATIVILALALCTAAHESAAQPYRRGPGGRPGASAPSDSLRTLSGPLQLWGHAGAGWLGGPTEFRRRYQAGLGLGVSGDRRFADRIALRTRVDYTDLPSTQPNTVLIGGIAYAVSSDYGHGWLGRATAGGAIRTWNHLWIDATAGAGYFDNGFSTSDTYEDLATGRQVRIEAASGWGSIWGAALRYEFQPSRRDRVLAEVLFNSMDRDGTDLRFFAIRFGYRAF